MVVALAAAGVIALGFAVFTYVDQRQRSQAEAKAFAKELCQQQERVNRVLSGLISSVILNQPNLDTRLVHLLEKELNGELKRVPCV